MKTRVCVILVIFSVVPATLFASGAADRAESGLPVPVQEAYAMGLAPEHPDDAEALPMRVSSIRGMAVHNHSLTRIGRVRGIVLDLAAGYAPYLVMSFEELLDGSSERYPIPLRMLRLNTEQDRIYVDISDPAMVRAAPAVEDITDRGDATDMMWDDRVYTYWRLRGITAPSVAFGGTYSRYRFSGITRGMRVLLASVTDLDALVGTVVAAGTVGRARVEDAVFEPLSGEVPALLLVPSTGPTTASGAGQDESALVAVPLEIMEVFTDEETLQFAETTASLEEAPRWNGDAPADSQVRRARDFWISPDSPAARRGGARVTPDYLVGLERLLNLRVMNTEGGVIGRVRDFGLDLDGRVDEVLVEFYFDQGALHPLDPTAFTLDRFAQVAVVGLSISEARALEAGSEAQLLYTELTQASAATRDDEEVAIVDALMDVGDAELSYVVVSVVGSGFLATAQIAVPAERVRSTAGGPAIEADLDMLNSAPRFEPANWPRFSDTEWEERVMAYWGTAP